ncbi:MAG: excinuclease ABC subunit UvrA, partial [Acidobacteriota bacterium]|nr:excinuclease ABC subunit UvrA [Acidobacteriota bacterium]
PHCPVCGTEITKQSPNQILEQVFSLYKGERIMILAPIARGRKGEYKKELEAISKSGFRARIDGEIRTLEEAPTKLDKRKNHTIEVVIDRLVIKSGVEQRLENSIQTALKWADGLVIVAVVEGPERLYSEKLACPNDGTSIPQLEPRSFSFNSPYGACETCKGVGSTWAFDPVKVICDPSKPLLDGGLGPGSSSSYMNSALVEMAELWNIDLSVPFEDLPKKGRTQLLHGDARHPGILQTLDDNYARASEGYREWLMEYMSPTVCPACEGRRLKPASLAVQVKQISIAEFTGIPIARALPLIKAWQFGDRELQVVGRVREEIQNRLEFLCAVGLDYLSLDRSSATLSGGEAQRIRLATQIGSKLRGVLYVLDEPSIGLHPRDNGRLIDTLHHLRDLGNTVLVVEHDAETIERSDYVIDLGPHAGRLGGNVIAQGSPAQIMRTPQSLTGEYLSGNISIPTPAVRRRGNGLSIRVQGAREHNLKNVSVDFPLGTFTVVTGVSGSGKSSLVHDILYRALAKEVYGSSQAPGLHETILGLENIDKVIEIDQSAIGRTPRSNPATYTGVFGPIREIYSMLPESRERGYKAGRFSFNVKGGRCEACQGDGLKRIEMNFLPDVYVTCDVCRGRRYNVETLQVKYRGKSIADLLESTVDEALESLTNIPQVHAKLKTLTEVGLGYLHLGQSSTTLSGGEAQRIKLAKELSKRQTGRTFYVLDEPTTGLHFDDVRKLLEVLQRLVDLGNTVVVIEHNLDVIKNADYLIDIGPEGGEGGGEVVAMGTPEEVLQNTRSHTAEALRKIMIAQHAA